MPGYQAMNKEELVEALSFQVAGMRSRRCVRAISARVSDVAGVLTVEVDLRAGTLRVTGTADACAVLAAITIAGYQATAMPVNAATQQQSDEEVPTVD